MKDILCYNTFYQCFTDGKSAWNDKDKSKGFIPKDRAMIYFKLNGKRISAKEMFNPKYLIKTMPHKRDFPDWCYD